MTKNIIPKGFAALQYLKYIPIYGRFQWLNREVINKVLERFLKPSTKGRKGYDKVWMFKWLIYKQITSCSYRDLETMTGIDYSTFIKFRSRLVNKLWFPAIFKKLVDGIASNLKDITLIIDSSFVETYSKKDEIDSEYFGYKQRNGFKLHQMIDWKTRLPLLQFCTPGARADIVWGSNLIRAAPKNWKVKAVLADKGYDADQFAYDIKLKWKKVKVGIPLRKLAYAGNLRNQFLRRWPRALNSKLLNKRTEIERYFSRKKHVFNLGEERTRHLKNFRANCYLTSIMEILEWMSKILTLFTKLLSAGLTSFR
jgi:transposase